ncbi:MAG TPA: BTAD domain-containing putative transcriptional regulator [Gemmatimonadales bacterium]|nr:BTAD domain-containing putative transcriptional regulator [Gemmatimonadales bacterium]
MEEQRLDIRLLGPPEILVDGDRLEVDTRKAIALLAYLAVESSATRDGLAALFWRDSDTERARATLRRTLSALRTAAGANTVEADRLRVNLRPGVISDVAEFKDAIDATGHHGHDPIDVCPECILDLRRATSLYRGDFLEGFSVRDAPEFEDWVRTTAEHLRLRAGEAFNRLASALAAEGDYPGAIIAIARWIELNPLHEPAHRQLMLFHAWAGDRPGAVEAYRRCVAILGEELEVSPLEETTELYEAILDEDLPPAPGIRRRVAIAPGPVRAIVSSGLIDRTAELALLERELESAREAGRVVVVTGEPWMGKTRLVEEFVAGAIGAPSLRARGFRAERALPFGVVVQLLRAMPRLPDGVAAWAVREVCRLVPEMSPGGLEPASPPTIHGETRLFDSLVVVLSAFAGPAVIWVDDSQWCDPASTSFLAYLANRIERIEHLLVLSLRSGEESPQSLRDVIRPGGLSRLVHLGPLLAADLTGWTSDAEKAVAAVEATGGVPILVSEYLAKGEGGIGLGVQRYVESHLAELGGLERQVLTSAAVLDGLCDLDLLRSTSGRSEEEVVEAVERLVGRDLLRVSVSGDAVAFALEAVESQVYESASLVRRRLLHGRAAAALKDVAQTSDDARLVAAIARHLQMSGGEKEAADWYARAGDLAFNVYAHAEAEISYHLALALGHLDPTRIRLALARLYLLTGRYREAMAEFEFVAATTGGAEAALAEHGIGEVHRRLGRFELAHSHFERARPDHPSPGGLHADWALLAHRSGDVAMAKDMAKLCLDEALASGSDSLMAQAHHLMGVVASELAEAGAHFENALELAGDDPVQRMASLNGLARLMSRSGDHHGAMSLVKEALELATKVGDRHRQAALLNHLADLSHQVGETRQAEELVTESVRLFAEIEPDAWEPEIWLLTGW